MSLASRVKRFSELSSRFECRRLHDLISEYRIPDVQFDELKIAALIYMSRCLPGSRTLLSEEAILEAFAENRESISNITPNGMIVPKRELTLEYNLLARAFIRIVSVLNIGDFIRSWHIPMNLRYKDGEAVRHNLSRPHATETMHSDSWAGESPDSVQVILPIFGDIENNFVDYYVPPEDFSEQWMQPLPTYHHGKEIALRYRHAGISQKPGHIYFADFATLHATTRRPGSRARVSIDTTFSLKRSSEENDLAEKKMHSARKKERAPHELLEKLGQDTVFFFFNRIGVNVEVGEGFKHPTDLNLVDLCESAKKSA